LVTERTIEPTPRPLGDLRVIYVLYIIITQLWIRGPRRRIRVRRPPIGFIPSHQGIMFHAVLTIDALVRVRRCGACGAVGPEGRAFIGGFTTVSPPNSLSMNIEHMQPSSADIFPPMIWLKTVFKLSNLVFKASTNNSGTWMVPHNL